MSDAKSYVPPFVIGEPLGGQTVSEVIASNNPEFAAGDMVLAFGGWQDYSSQTAAICGNSSRAQPLFRPPLASSECRE
jgi:NADPH-dependent curcumin reductase CurA